MGNGKLKITTMKLPRNANPNPQMNHGKTAHMPGTKPHDRRWKLAAALDVRASRCAGCWLLLLLLYTTAHAQYSIEWSTIDGGGGTSSGGGYSVSGTIGQSDAGGPMTNGQYSVTGGFWAMPTAVQVTNAPTLTISPATPGSILISWTPTTTGFVLQEALSLAPTNWVNSASGATNPVVVPAALPAKFYRLFKP